MKKMVYILLLLLFFFFMSFGLLVKASDKEIYFDDMTTKNFVSKSGYLAFPTIKKICSYDYCDYIKSENVKDALNIFTQNYLKTINDDEVRSSLKVKGVKITKIILN